MAITIKSNIDQGVNLGATANISGANLQAISSKGSPNSRIQYTLTSLPRYGQLLRGNVPLAIGATFTQADLIAGNIRYRSDSNVLILMVYFGVSVRDLDDPSSPAVSVEVPIRISIPPVPPNGTTSPMNVAQNGTVKATQNNINYDDLNTPGKWSQIFFQVLVLPEFGILYINGKKATVGANFTQADVNNGLISYTHIKDRNPTADKDQFIIQARDPQGNITPEFGVVDINIGLFDAPLVLVKNGPLVLNQDEKKTIDNTLLLASDADDPNLVITYKITVLPKNGILAKNNVPLTVGATFTQTDIDNGLLSYDHDGGISIADSFKFDVSHSKETLLNNTFNIIIKPVPNLPPLVSVLPIPVDYCKSVVIDKKYITISDPEGKPLTELTFTITELPQFGTLFIKGVPAKIGDKVTVNDVVNNAVLSYTHGCAKPEEETDLFKFTVSDGVNDVAAVGNIIINYVKNEPPYVVTNIPQQIERTSVTTVDFTVLNFDDKDSPAEEVLLIISELPEIGTLTYNGSVVTVGMSFKKSIWKDVKILYTVSTEDFDIEEVSFSFTLTDGTNDVGPFDHFFRFPPPPRGCPTLTNEPISMRYLETKLIDKDHLFATDPDVKPVNLIFTVTKVPQYGDFTFYGSPTSVESKISVRDIMNNAIAYKQTTGTPDTDEIHFTLSNGVCEIDLIFTINFERSLFSVINNPLTVIACGEGTIKGGDNPPLNPADVNLLYSNKLSTDPKTIAYTITTSVRSGIITVNGIETNTFTQDDLNNGVVKYQHDCSDSLTDQFEFSVTNGTETLNAIFEIIITPIDNPPTLVNNGITVGELSCKIINGGEISANDDNASAAELVFQLITLPQHGNLTKNGQILNPADTFTYEDILNGFVSYCNTVEDQLTDAFEITVTDGVNEPVGPEEVLVTIIPLPEPELINRVLSMAVCSERTITGGFLSIANYSIENDKKDAIFTVTRLPDIGFLKKNGIPMNVNETFTLDDIGAGVVTYQNDTMNDEPQSFDFTLSSPDISATGTFNIVFNASFNPPWVCVNDGMVVMEKSTTKLPQDSLQMCDIDLDADGDINTYPPMSSYSVDSEVVGDSLRYIQFLSVDSGRTYSYNLNVTSGSVRVAVTDIVTNKLVSTACVTSSSTGSFVIPQYVYEVSVDIQIGCNNSTENTWNLVFTG